MFLAQCPSGYCFVSKPAGWFTMPRPAENQTLAIIMSYLCNNLGGFIQAILLRLGTWEALFRTIFKIE